MRRLLVLIILMLLSLPLFAGGTAPGTVITNGGDQGIAGLDDCSGDVICTYQNGPAGKTSNAVSVEVSTGYAVGVAISPLWSSVLPGNATYYPLTITNYANVPDTITFSVAISSQPWPTSLIIDTNGDGIHQAGETTPAGSSTGLLSPDTAFKMFLYVSVPSTAAADQLSAAQITVKNQNGTGDNDGWPPGPNNDTIVLTAITMLDATPPVVICSSANPNGAIGVLGNRVIISARVSDPESGIASVDLHYQIDASTFVAAMVYSSGTYTIDLGGLITHACTLVYSVYSANGAGLVTAAPTITCVFGTQTSGGQISSGRVAVEDGNPDDGNTALVIPEGALTAAIPLTLTQESTATVTSASGGLAETAHPASAFELEPSGTIFVKPATLTILYNDLDNDGREDSTGQDERVLRVFWWDGLAWRYMGGEVDVEKNTVTVPVMHFSLFAVFPAKAPAPDDLRPKEKIITPNNDGMNDFAAFGLTGDFTVKVFNANGRLIRMLDSKNIWDGKDDSGAVVESGAYIYQFKTDNKTISGVIVVAK